MGVGQKSFYNMFKSLVFITGLPQVLDHRAFITINLFHQSIAPIYCTNLLHHAMRCLFLTDSRFETWTRPMNWHSWGWSHWSTRWLHSIIYFGNKSENLDIFNCKILEGVDSTLFVPALAALYLTLVSGWLTHCHFRILTQRVTFVTWDPSDIWSECYTDEKRKRQKDRKTKYKKGKKDNDQKESLILWCSGSFALLRCLGSYCPSYSISIFCCS